MCLVCRILDDRCDRAYRTGDAQQIANAEAERDAHRETHEQALVMPSVIQWPNGQQWVVRE